MNITSTEFKSTLPRKANRSRRLQKKLHLGEFSQTLVELVLIADSVDIWNSTKYDAILDALYEADFDFATFGGTGVSFEIMYEQKSSEFSLEDAKEKIDKVLEVLAGVSHETVFTRIHVLHGDSYYGAWAEEIDYATIYKQG